MTEYPDLDSYRARCCTGKLPLHVGQAHDKAMAKRARGEPCDAYRCPFHADHPHATWHVGHPLGMTGLATVAALLRARSGNAPAEPGSGLTSRQRKAVRRGRRNP